MKTENLRAIKALFNAMERTLFICRHNIRLDCGDNEYERFWLEYYERYIERTLPRCFEESYANETAQTVAAMLERGTKDVYNINPFALLSADLQAKPPAELLAGVSRLNARRQELEEKFSIRMRDELRKRLEILIQQAFGETAMLEAQVASHWEPSSMAAFMEQLSGGEFGGILYSYEAWRAEYRPEIIGMIEAAAA